MQWDFTQSHCGYDRRDSYNYHMISPSTCLRCPHVQPPPYAGPCACTIDGRDILDHQATGDCPKGFADAGPMPSLPIPADFDPQQELRRLKQGGCCSPPVE